MVPCGWLGRGSGPAPTTRNSLFREFRIKLSERNIRPQGAAGIDALDGGIDGAAEIERDAEREALAIGVRWRGNLRIDPESRRDVHRSSNVTGTIEGKGGAGGNAVLARERGRQEHRAGWAIESLERGLGAGRQGGVHAILSAAAGIEI